MTVFETSTVIEQTGLLYTYYISKLDFKLRIILYSVSVKRYLLAGITYSAPRNVFF